MKLKSIACIAALVMLSNAAIAKQVTNKDLNSKRTQAVIQYIDYLGKADYKHLANLFTKNGIVVSTSRGTANAKEFFYDFLPNVASGKTVLKKTFTGVVDQAARFNLELNLKDGDKVKGEFVDEFVFEENSAKLQAVYMFENLNFPADK